MACNTRTQKCFMRANDSKFTFFSFQDRLISDQLRRIRFRNQQRARHILAYVFFVYNSVYYFKDILFSQLTNLKHFFLLNMSLNQETNGAESSSTETVDKVQGLNLGPATTANQRPRVKSSCPISVYYRVSSEECCQG